MKANPEFNCIPDSIWGMIDLISENSVSERTSTLLKSFKKIDIIKLINDKKLEADYITVDILHNYMNERADVLNKQAKQNIRTKNEMIFEFAEYTKLNNSRPPIKRGDEILYLSTIAAMIANSICGFENVISEPSAKAYHVVSGGGCITTSDRPDGAIPTLRNPQLVWEVKEYWNGDSYGSRVNDSIRVLELNARRFHNLPTQHVFLLDGYDSVWTKGRPLCCRLFDLLNQGFVHAVLFGRELETTWPQILQSLQLPPSSPFSFNSLILPAA